jgi:hypothetical protein
VENSDAETQQKSNTDLTLKNQRSSKKDQPRTNEHDSEDGEDQRNISNSRKERNGQNDSQLG